MQCNGTKHTGLHAAVPDTTSLSEIWGGKLECLGGGGGGGGGGRGGGGSSPPQ